MIAHFITSKGNVTSIHPCNGVHFTPDEMQKKVKGEFEFLLTTEKHTLIVNKEANEQKINFNQEASELVNESKVYGDVIVCQW